MLALEITILIILVVIIIFLYKQYYAPTQATSTVAPASTSSATEGFSLKSLKDRRAHAIKNTVHENIEHFATMTDNIDPAATDEFLPTTDFKTWVADKSISPEQRASHAAFVQDRIVANGVNITGKTWTPSNLGEF
jgi:hypothetical protein